MNSEYIQIKRHLTVYDYNFNDVDIDFVTYVPMSEYRISNKGYLFLDNLQICRGIFLWSPIFSFVAHIRPVDGDKSFFIDENSDLKCSVINELRNILLYFNTNNDNNIKLGIFIGCSPLEETNKYIRCINQEIDKLLKDFSDLNIYKCDDNHEMTFILNCENGDIILPKLRKLK